ncbi:MAG: DUF1634 domain-containing protein [Planctomycetota bacterium]|jgi:hypothetical protein
MDEDPDAALDPTPEQLLYAGILEKGMFAGLACLFITFALYVFGILGPYIPLKELPQHWSKKVDEYLTDAEIHAGWSWVGMLKYGDFVNFIGIAVLAGVTVLSYLAIVPLLLKSRDYIYAALAALEVLVLAAAASGIIAGGH